MFVIASRDVCYCVFQLRVKGLLFLILVGHCRCIDVDDGYVTVLDTAIRSVTPIGLSVSLLAKSLFIAKATPALLG